MSSHQIKRIKTITEYHQLRRLSKPEHPLISVIDFSKMQYLPENDGINWVCDFYFIAVKKNLGANIIYGRQKYDFNDGVLFFIAPGQVYRIETNQDTNADRSGWILLIHPDFLWNFPLAASIKRYEYFGYSVSEALFLSEKEEMTLSGVMKSIQQEYHANIDKFSQQIIISHIEVLLNYADRFYHRQFITRKITNHQVLAQLEQFLDNHFSNDNINKGLLTVQSIADHLDLSPDYLSSLLKLMTGQNTQQHIHEKLIERAKGRLLSTNLSISEIAYELGFEHSQSFSKLFKSKTNFSPLEFRNSLN